MGGDHRAADRRVIVGRLWVKGFGEALAEVEVHTVVSLGGGF